MEIDELPADVIAAATVLHKFFANRNIKDWKLGSCASRYQAERMEDGLQMARSRFADLADVAEKNDATNAAYIVSMLRKSAGRCDEYLYDTRPPFALFPEDVTPA